MGKGSKPRPVDKQTFDQNFDRIFGHGKDQGSDSGDGEPDRGSEKLRGSEDADNPSEASAGD